MFYSKFRTVRQTDNVCHRDSSHSQWDIRPPERVVYCIMVVSLPLVRLPGVWTDRTWSLKHRNEPLRKGSDWDVQDPVSLSPNSFSGWWTTRHLGHETSFTSTGTLPPVTPVHTELPPYIVDWRGRPSGQ